MKKRYRLSQDSNLGPSEWQKDVLPLCHGDNCKNLTKNVELILKMTSILNQYFHSDGTIPLFNGSNNIYTKIILYILNPL